MSHTIMRITVAARCLVVGSLLLAAGCSASAVPSADTASVNKPIPVTLPRDDGTLTAIPVPGKSVVLDFWSPSCGPCKKTIPAVLAKRAEIESRGAVHMLVGVLEKDESIEDARATLSLWGINEPFLVDREGAFMAKVGARDVPAFAIIDSAGVLVWVAPDGVTISNVLAAIP